MFRRMISEAVVAALALGAMTAVALAGPLGLPQQSKTQKGGITPVAFVFDGQQTLFTAIENFSFLLQRDDQGNLFAVDPNKNVWVSLGCCAIGQVDTEQGPVFVAAGIFWQQSGAYGAPFVYDGGLNILVPWMPQQ
jgi:predicted small lipoprotein YifL